MTELTIRQQQIMALISQGRKTSQVAEELGLTLPYIFVQISNSMARLGAKTRVEAVLKFKEHYHASPDHQQPLTQI